MRYKKKKWLALVLAVCLLSACSSPKPSLDQNSNPWEETWVQLGNVFGVGQIPGFTLLENKEVLAADGLYYAAWTAGDSRPYINEDETEVDLYDAHLYLLVCEREDSISAEAEKERLLAAARENYQPYQEEAQEIGGVSYEILMYDCNSETSPYDHGISAFSSFGNLSVCAELTCLSSWEKDLKTDLEAFLENCHYVSK